MNPKRRKRKRIGARALFLAVSVFAILAGASQKAPDAYAVVAGTVFRNTGFSLRGAEVTLQATTLPPGVRKFKALKLISDGRGEFAFRVPAGKAVYTITVKADGYQTAEKSVTVNADERADVYFELTPLSK